LRLGKTRERLRPEIFELEQATDLPPGALGDNECPRCGQRLQPGGEVRRLSNHSALLRRTRSDQVADHDQPAGDAEPHIQRLRRLEPADSVDDGEPGANCPFGVVLVRLRIAKIDQHAVAHVFGDKTGKPADGVGDAAVIGPDDLAQILGVIARRQRRRPDQVTEHHGELAPLSVIGARWYRRCYQLLAGRLPDRFATAAAEPRGGLILKATRRAGSRQRRTTLLGKSAASLCFRPCSLGSA
jgi:hypothetical protein